MGVGGKLVHALELERARSKSLALELFALDRRDLAAEEARRLRRERAFKTARGIGVDLSPRDLVAAREVLSGVAHGDVGGRIAQRFPEKILEIDGAHAEAAHGVGCDRIAAHRFGADAQREPDRLMRDDVRGLDQHLEAGAADSLHHMRGHLDRDAGIESDMAGQAVGIEARLRHRAGDHRADVLGRHAGPRKRGARRLDAEVGRRDLRQWAVVVRKRRAHAVEQPHVAPGRAQACRLAHDHGS
jgi:hypothetical protein